MFDYSWPSKEEYRKGGCVTDIKKLVDEGCFCWYCRQELEKERNSHLKTSNKEKEVEEYIPSWTDGYSQQDATQKQSGGGGWIWVPIDFDTTLNIGDEIRGGGINGEVTKTFFGNVTILDSNNAIEIYISKTEMIDNGYEVLEKLP